MIKSLSKIYYSKQTKFLVWLLASFFYSLQMTLRILPAMMVDHMTNNLGMNAAEIGLLAGFYYVGYAGVQIPLGIILDKFHPRYVISSCILVAMSGLLLTIYATGKTEIYIARFLIGIGSVGGILGSVKAIDDFFPKKYSLFLGCTVLCGVIGSFYGGVPIGRSISSLGIENTLFILVYIGMILAILLLFLYHKSHTDDKVIKNITVKEIIKTALSNKFIWAIGILGGMMVGPLGGFGDMWSSRYLEQIKEIDHEIARFATSMVFLGLGIGSTITGYISLKFKNLSKLIATMGFMQICVIFILFFIVKNNIFLICILMLLIGLLSSYQIVVFSLADKIAKNHLIGVVTSLVNSLIMIFGFFFNYCIGKILKIFFASSSSEKLIYDAYAFHSAFSVIIIGIIIGAVGFLMISKYEKRNYA